MSYSWRKFRRALLGLAIGLLISLFLLWLFSHLDGEYALMASGAYVFLVAPFFVQWVMDLCRHPDDVDGSNVKRMFKGLLRRITRGLIR